MKNAQKNSPMKTLKRTFKMKKATAQWNKPTNPYIIHIGVPSFPPIKAKVIKPNANTKLVLRKNTRLAAQKRKITSQPISMFSLIVDSFLIQDFLTQHDESVCGYTLKTQLKKAICQVIIDFSCLRNEVIEL